MYENLHRLPRALVVDSVVAVKDEPASKRYFESVSIRLPSGALRVKELDPSRKAVVEGLPAGTARQIAGCDEPGRAQIRSYASDRVVVDVDTKCPGLVLLTDIYYPGWKARVNRSPAKVYPTDIAFRGVPVGAGRSTVEFHYEPKSFRIGIVLALVAALTACGALVVSSRSLGARRGKPISSRRPSLRRPAHTVLPRRLRQDFTAQSRLRRRR